MLLSAGWRKRRGSVWLRTTGGILLAAAIVCGVACLAPAPAMAAVSPAAAPTIYLLPPTAPASLPAESAQEAPAAQTTTGITTTRVISYTYDPLSRLTAAEYSTGEIFGYAYDAVGNRTRMTETITSTVVTSYTYDEANRLTHVDGNPLTSE
ncbi:MAG: RHS repeat protein [Anaerolineales bacterium]|nr:RHS repeat protein [Anaerolineales bacterium]